MVVNLDEHFGAMRKRERRKRRIRLYNQIMAALFVLLVVGLFVATMIKVATK